LPPPADWISASLRLQRAQDSHLATAGAHCRISLMSPTSAKVNTATTMDGGKQAAAFPSFSARMLRQKYGTQEVAALRSHHQRSAHRVEERGASPALIYT